MSYHDIVAITADHLDDMITVFTFYDRRYLAFFETESRREENRVPHFTVVAVEFDLAAFFFTAGIIGIDLGEEVKFFRTGFYLRLVFVELVHRQLLDIAAGLGIDHELVEP